MVDKALHFLCGMFISFSPISSDSEALNLSLLAGAGKEIYDSTGRGTVDVKDFLSTAAGGVVGYELRKSLHPKQKCEAEGTSCLPLYDVVIIKKELTNISPKIESKIEVKIEVKENQIENQIENTNNVK